MIVAVEGCCHGELDAIYASLALAEEQTGTKVDLLLICGDFQAVRNAADLAGMACPPKYRSMHDFHKYYSGEKVAPVLTIFIGGNHEASAHLAGLHHGGWAAPKIYYLGFAGVVRVGGLRIGGLSGIYNGRHYRLGHYEVPPFSDDDMRSFYHVRELDVLRLMQLRQPMDVFISHDWPQHIARHGDTAHLVRRKAFLKKEIDDGSLGSPPGMQLLQHLQPRYWFCAHLHVKFAAVVGHASGNATRFLSLSKCLPGSDFLQLLRIDGDGIGSDGSVPVISYDAEWIAVLRATQHLHSSVRQRLPLDPASVALASGGRNSFTPTAEELQAVRECMGAAPGGSEEIDISEESDAPAAASDAPDPFAMPLNFAISAPPYREGESIHAPQEPLQENQQTTAFIQKFGLERNFRVQRGATLDVAGARGGGSVPFTTPQPPPALPPPPSALPPPPSGHGAQASHGYFGDPAGYAPPPQGAPSYVPLPHHMPPPPPFYDPAGYAPRPLTRPPPGPPIAFHPGAQAAGTADPMFAPMPLDEEIDLDDD